MNIWTYSEIYTSYSWEQPVYVRCISVHKTKQSALNKRNKTILAIKQANICYNLYLSEYKKIANKQYLSEFPNGFQINIDNFLVSDKLNSILQQIHLEACNISNCSDEHYKLVQTRLCDAVIEEKELE